MLVVVQKPFTGHGVDFVRGQLIDAEQFGKAGQLMDQHYIRAATQDEIANARYEDEDDAPTPAAPKKKKLTAKLRKRS